MNALSLLESCRAARPNLRWFSPASPADPPSLPADALVTRALSGANPAEAFLRDAAGVGRLLLIVNDPDRATDTVSALSALFPIIERLGSRFAIQALVASGSHPVPPESDRNAFEERCFGPHRGRIAPATWHDSRDPAHHVEIGGTRMNRAWAEHDFAIAIGSVEPHYFAGFTGAHKTATIGTMGYGDIQKNHEGTLSASARILVLDGNPIYDGVLHALEALARAGKHIYAINQVLYGGTVVACFAGHPIASLKEAANIARRYYVASVERPADLAVLRAEGPLGETLYQADKALQNNHPAVRDGGGIVLVAPLRRGIGPSRFFEQLQHCESSEAVGQAIRRDGYHLGDHKAANLRRLSDSTGRGLKLALVSERVSESEAAVAGLRKFTDLASAISYAVPTDARFAIAVPDAGNITVSVGQKVAA